MAIALFILYLVTLGFATAYSRFLRSARLSPVFLAALFLIYSAAGCAHLWIAYHFYPEHGDIWRLFQVSVDLKRELVAHPRLFFQDFVPDDFNIDMTGKYSRWSYLQYDIIAGILLLLNFLSADNLYINTLLFCFITLYGHMALYRMLSAVYPQHHLLCLLAAFLIPSLIFWTSVVHKEGMLFAVMSILFYCLWKLLDQKGSAISNPQGERTKMRPLRAVSGNMHLSPIKHNSRYILGFVLCLGAIFLLRKFLLISLIPSLAIWIIAEKTRYRKRWITLGIAVGSALAYWLAGQLHPSFDILYQMSDRQSLFLQLEGGSRMILPLLENSWKSLLSLFPYALVNGLFMPLPGTGGQAIYSLFGIELLLMWALIAYALYYGASKKAWHWTGFEACCLFFVISGCILTGYMIPFAGAIIRYRSIFYPFLLIPFLGILQYHPAVVKLNKWIGKIINTNYKK